MQIACCWMAQTSLHRTPFWITRRVTVSWKLTSRKRWLTLVFQVQRKAPQAPPRIVEHSQPSPLQGQIFQFAFSALQLHSSNKNNMKGIGLQIGNWPNRQGKERSGWHVEAAPYRHGLGLSKTGISNYSTHPTKQVDLWTPPLQQQDFRL